MIYTSVLFSQDTSGLEELILDKVNKTFVIDSVILKSSIFNNTRRLRILLPPDYYISKDRDYPVLYMNDGVMVFHAYNIKEVVHNLINSKKIEPLIIVGIDNGASTFESNNPLFDRANEYLPWPDYFDIGSSAFVQSPKGSLYPEFLFGEVIPLIEKEFRVKQRAEHRAIGGASRGALIALYTTLKMPLQISKLLLESPSLYVSNQKIIELAEAHTYWPKKIYMGIGTLEGDSEEIREMVVADTDTLNSIIKNNSEVSEVKYIVESGKEHTFEAFSDRFPKALYFLYKKD